jgi:hypothetical protein
MILSSPLLRGKVSEWLDKCHISWLMSHLGDKLRNKNSERKRGMGLVKQRRCMEKMGEFSLKVWYDSFPLKLLYQEDVQASPQFAVE